MPTAGRAVLGRNRLPIPPVPRGSNVRLPPAGGVHLRGLPGSAGDLPAAFPADRSDPSDRVDRGDGVDKVDWVDGVDWVDRVDCVDGVG
jgi:hypothetical protein